MAPRIRPLSEDKIGPDEERALGVLATRKPLHNVFATFARHPDLFRRYSVFGNHILAKSELLPRHREILILRIGYRNRCAYEYAQHSRIGREAGLTDEEISDLAQPEISSTCTWNRVDALLVKVADELYDSGTVSDSSWSRLEQAFSEHQRMDIVFTVGAYNMASWALNAFGVELDADLDKVVF